MAVPVINPGDVATSAIANKWFLPIAVVKPSDTGRISDTTQAPDPDLVIPLLANSTYEVDMVLFYDGGAGGSPNEGDIRYTFTIPSGASGQIATARQDTSGDFVGAGAYNWTDSVVAQTVGVGTILCIPIKGYLIIGGTAGNLTFEWAQATSASGANTHVKAGSYMVARRIA